MPADIGFDFNWVLDKPRDVAVVFASRMALRVAPLLAGVRGLRGGAAEDFGEAVVLPVFRAMAAAWVAGQYPAHGPTVAHAADAACAAASFVAYGPRSARLASARSTANAASRAAGVAASNDPAAVFYNPDAGRGAVDACLAATETTTPADFSAAARADSEMIDNGASASALAALPLWSAGRPGWAPEAWKRLEETLLAEDRDWQAWTGWYRARLEGEAAHEALEVARVLIREDMWQLGPRAVNAEIARLIAEHGKSAG
jgi:hypothetical protein